MITSPVISEQGLRATLEGLLEQPVKEVPIAEGRSQSSLLVHGFEPDLVARAGSSIVVLECKGSGDSAPVALALSQLKSYVRALEREPASPDSAEIGRVLPILVVPYMGAAGQRLCEEAGIGWFDLSGNAHIVAPGLKIRILGLPNLFKRPGRPSDLFAPKSSRVARLLLQDPSRVMSQREISRQTGLGEGHVSRLVHRFEEDGLIAREGSGAVKVVNPDLLLDSWREGYDFFRHRITRGHVASRSGEQLLERITGELERQSVDYAATGLAAAWQLVRFAGCKRSRTPSFSSIRI